VGPDSSETPCVQQPVAAYLGRWENHCGQPKEEHDYRERKYATETEGEEEVFAVVCGVEVTGY